MRSATSPVLDRQSMGQVILLTSSTFMPLNTSNSSESWVFPTCQAVRSNRVERRVLSLADRFEEEGASAIIRLSMSSSGVSAMQALIRFSKSTARVAMYPAEARSEERRVGKEDRSRWSRDH